MFNLYTGIPGSGKTLLAVNDVWEQLEAGKEVWSNTFINWKDNGQVHYFSDPEDIIDKRNCVIFFDEIGSILDSRNWAETSREVRYFFQQHRKRGIDIIATTQHSSFIEKSARCIVGYWAEVSNLTPTEGIKGRGGIGKKLPFLLIREVPISSNIIDSVLQVHIWFKSDVFDRRYQKNKLEPQGGLYDTNREIELPVRSHIVRLLYKCEKCGKEHPYRGAITEKERSITQELLKLASGS